MIGSNLHAESYYEYRFEGAIRALHKCIRQIQKIKAATIPGGHAMHHESNTGRQE